jgi:hypothetical protein
MLTVERTREEGAIHASTPRTVSSRPRIANNARPTTPPPGCASLTGVQADLPQPRHDQAISGRHLQLSPSCSRSWHFHARGLRRLLLQAFTLDAFPAAKILAGAFRLLLLITPHRAAFLAAVDDGVARVSLLMPSSTVSHFRPPFRAFRQPLYRARSWHDHLPLRHLPDVRRRLAAGFSGEHSAARAAAALLPLGRRRHETARSAAAPTAATLIYNTATMMLVTK